MNAKTASIACVALCSLPLLTFAQSLYQTQLKQLTEQRDKALAAAAQPINKKYQESLEQLLLRASRSNDAEAVAAIADAFKALGAKPESEPSGGLATQERIRDLLTSNVWVHRGDAHYKFTKNGRFEFVEGNQKGRYKIDPKTSSVSFIWDNLNDKSCGMRIDEAKKIYTHFHGEPFIPVPK
jgi:hypothetical protein